MREAIDNYIVAIEHIGSTSIVGLDAKPIIDILVGVQKLDDAENCIAPLTRIEARQGLLDAFIFAKELPMFRRIT